MKYYKDPDNGNVFAYESEQERQEWGAPGLVEMTPAEVDAHLNPPPEPEPVPYSVTRAQGKAALIMMGLWQSVLDYWASISDHVEKDLAGVALNDTTHWQRDSPFLNEAASALGLTQEQLDSLFKQAAEVEL